eukprot:gene5419-965_t
MLAFSTDGEHVARLKSAGLSFAAAVTGILLPADVDRSLPLADTDTLHVLLAAFQPRLLANLSTHTFDFGDMELVLLSPPYSMSVGILSGTQVGTNYWLVDQAVSLVQYAISVSERLDIPSYLETHRNTATQDVVRLSQLVARVPEVQLTLDGSHLLDILCPDPELSKMLDPIFDRVCSIHARVADGIWGHIQ